MNRHDAAEEHPERFGAYELLERLGAGGMAEVFLARRADGSGELVALKRVLPHFAARSEFVSMFHDEARLASLLDHPNIASAVDSGRAADGSYYLALEYVHGHSLEHVHELVASGVGDPRLGRAVLLFAVRCVAEALAYAHDQRDSDGLAAGIVHRDISPPNVLIGYEGEVKLIDFGVAKRRARLVKTSGGQLKGKLAYMSPEQAGGNEVDRRSDLFSLGSVLYELLTDIKLFDAPNDILSLERVLHAPVPEPCDVADVPEPLSLVTLRALERDVEMRFQDARQLANALDAAIAGAGLVTDAVAVGRWMREHAGEHLAAHLVDAPAVDPRSPTLDDQRSPTFTDQRAPPLDDQHAPTLEATALSAKQSSRVGADTREELETLPSRAPVVSHEHAERQEAKTLQDLPAQGDSDSDTLVSSPSSADAGMSFLPTTIGDEDDAATLAHDGLYDPDRTLPPTQPVRRIGSQRRARVETPPQLATPQAPEPSQEAETPPTLETPSQLPGLIDDFDDDEHDEAARTSKRKPRLTESGPLPALNERVTSSMRRRTISLLIAIFVLLASSVAIFVLLVAGD